jgi:uncharacterized protein (DUF1697 family)
MTATRTSNVGTTFVALLRGINVGGNNMIKMSALKVSCAELGFDDVSTYINSGNVLFRTRSTDPRQLEATIERMLVAKHRLACKVVIRSAAQMAGLVKRLPKDWSGGKDWRYNVIFLRHTIDSKDVIGAVKWKPEFETVTYVPGTLLWSAHVKDITKTAMLKLASQPIFQDMTVRNLNTTKKLHELMQKMG